MPPLIQGPDLFFMYCQSSILLTFVQLPLLPGLAEEVAAR